MTVTANEVALASVLTTLVIGSATVITTWRDRAQNKILRTEDRAHERELAHDGRTYEGKSDTYVSMLEVLETFGLHMQRTEPIVSFGGEDPKIPPLPGVTEQMPLLARVEALGSHAVYQMYRDFIRHVYVFDAAVGTLRSIREQESLGTQTQEAWDRVERLRAEGRERIEKIAEQVRNELAAPGGAHVAPIELPAVGSGSV